MKVKRIIFVDKNGTSRALMASKIFISLHKSDIEVFSRGVLVAFPEPANPLAEAVLASDGIDIGGFKSSRLEEEDVVENTIILALDESIKQAVISRIGNANEENTFEMCEYSGEDLTITNPYGGSVTAYGLCYESIKNVVKHLIDVLEEK